MKALYYFKYTQTDDKLSIPQRFFIHYWLRQLDRRISSHERSDLVGVNFLLSELLECFFELESGNVSKYDVIDIFNEIKWELSNDYIMGRIKKQKITKLKKRIIDAKKPEKILDLIFELKFLLSENYRKLIWQELRKLTNYKFEDYSVLERIAKITNSLVKEVIYIDYPLEFTKLSHFKLLNPKKDFCKRFSKFEGLIEKPEVKKIKIVFKINLGKTKMKELGEIKFFRKSSIRTNSKAVIDFLDCKKGYFLVYLSVNERTMISAAFEAHERLQLFLDILGVSHFESTKVVSKCLAIRPNNSFEVIGLKRLYLGFAIGERLMHKRYRLAHNSYFDRLSLERLRTTFRNYRYASSINFPIWLRSVFLWQSIESLGRTGGVKETARELAENISNLYASNYVHWNIQRYKTNLYNAGEDVAGVKEFYGIFKRHPYLITSSLKKNQKYLSIAERHLNKYEIFIYDLLQISSKINSHKNLVKTITHEKNKIYWSLKRFLRIRNLFLHKSQVFLSNNQLQYLLSDMFGVFETLVRQIYLEFEKSPENSLEKINVKLFHNSKEFISKLERNELSIAETINPLSVTFKNKEIST